MYIKQWLPTLKMCLIKIYIIGKVYSKYDINYSKPIIVYEDEYKK